MATSMRAALAASVLVLAAGAAPASAQGFIRDAEIEQILREYSNPIFEAAGLNPSDVDIYLINDPSLNAFVANGQKVHLNTGLIQDSDTPEQLKGVIAHETGHITGGHSVTRGQALEASMGAALISIGLGVIAIAAGAPDAGAALIASSQQFALLTFFQYTQNEESAADQAGIGFMQATGQSADGLVEFMEKFRYQEQMSAGRRDPYFRTHPMTNDRIGAIRARAAEASAAAKPQSERAKQQLERMKAKLIGFLETPARVYNRYPATDLSVPARYARAIAAYRAVDIQLAERETSALIALEPDNPWFNELMGQILFENGRAAESVPFHRVALSLAPEQSLLYVNLARSLLAVGGNANIEEAESLLNDALRREPDNAFAWGQLAQAYGQLGRTGEAQLATAEQAYSIGDYQRAYIFARRARDTLDPKSPQGQRASDISAISDPRGRPGARRG